MFKKIVLLMAVMFLSVVSFTGCELTDDGSEDLQIKGYWVDGYSTNHTITNSSWVTDGAFGYSNIVSEYDNAANTLYYIQDSKSTYNAGKYGKIVWTEPVPEDSHVIFYECIVAYGKDTLAEIKADTTTVDSSDPANGGCGGFSWTKLTLTKRID